MGGTPRPQLAGVLFDWRLRCSLIAGRNSASLAQWRRKA